MWYDAPVWDLSELEKALNNAGFPTPNYISYVDGVVYTHNDAGELVPMDDEAQAYADVWILNATR